MQHRNAIAWFRRDLRLADNPALTHAVTHAAAVECLHVADDPEAPLAPGSASHAWLERSLAALDASLVSRGARLTRRPGPAAATLPMLASATGATLVTCTRDWSPSGLAEETAARNALRAIGVELHVAESQLLVPPDALLTGGGTPYAVFTPYSRAWLAAWRPRPPLPAPALVPARVSPGVPGDAAAVADGASGLPHAHDGHWVPGEAGAQKRLAAFSAERVAAYGRDRDLPAVEGTSELSPHLAFGEVSPRQVVAAVLADSDESVAWPFLRQLAWREFTYHVLHAHPTTQTEALRPQFATFPWRRDPVGTQAWLAGLTGFPLVDAGMRQLAQTGWMHNRVRLVAASFLVKDLLVPWQVGETAFRERLVDFDPAANAFNWQWVAGSGADAAPYFRVFNPKTQAARFDPLGEYVRRWVPEIGTAEYPAPVVDHAEARARALGALAAMRTCTTEAASTTWE